MFSQVLDFIYLWEFAYWWHAEAEGGEKAHNKSVLIKFQNVFFLSITQFPFLYISTFFIRLEMQLREKVLFLADNFA